MPRIILICLCFLLFVVSLAVGSYAYFKTDLTFNGYANVKIDLMFDRLTDAALKQYWDTFKQDDGSLALRGNDGLDGKEMTGDYVWGHKGNPYVISHTKHLQNLSTLQNIGYFKNKFLETNYTQDATGKKVLKDRDTATYFDGYNLPHFLVSTVEAKPIVIDAGGETIKPVGNDDFPFVGVLRGVSDKAVAVPLSTGTTTTTSAIDGVTVSDTPAKADHGFFGQIGYLGSELENKPVDEAGNVLIFEGQISVVSDLLLSDAKIVVQSSLWEKVKEFITDHLFTYTPMIGSEQEDTLPHENHHIGILAAHVEYANFSNISIYYSADDIPAFDLNDATDINGVRANYSSVTGIFGFVYNLNPEVNENGEILVGSGVNQGDLSVGSDGGGGTLSGENPGYIRAKEMYEKFHYYGAGNEQPGDILISNATDFEGNSLTSSVTSTELSTDGGWRFQRVTRYYFTDGVFTFALSENQNDTISDLWETVDGVVNAPAYELGGNADGDWTVGSLKNALEFYTDLTPVNSIDTAKNYVIGGKGTDGSFGLIDLPNGGSGSVPLKTLSAVPILDTESGKYRFTYDNASDREEINAYRVNVTGGASTGTYVISSQLGENKKLGVERPWGLSGNNITIYAGISNDSNYWIGGTDYEYDVSSIYDHVNRSWSFSITNNKVKYYITITAAGLGISTSSADAAKFYFFDVSYAAGKKAGADAPKGYVPVEGTGYAGELLANQYVLRPQTEAGAAEVSSNTPVYDLVALSELGWKDQNGTEIWKEGDRLTKVFSMKSVVNWGVAASIGGFGIGINGKGGLIKAPVGSNGTLAYIPTGSLAFNINKVPEGGAKIRVIVAVPQGSKVDSLGFDRKKNAQGADYNDYYLGIWKGTGTTSGDFFSYSGFNKEEAYAKIELPRSQPKEMAQDAEGNYLPTMDGLNEYVSVNFGGTTYRAYLQGDRYLIAYEFNVSEGGVYILAASDSAMQLVYCSVDGIASAGRDGSGGTKIGTVDFVYDNRKENDNTNKGRVVLVSDYSSETGGAETSDFYYRSNVILYFDNEISENNTFVSLNYERLYVRRSWNDAVTDGVKSAMTVKVYDESTDTARYIKIRGYNRTYDRLNPQYTFEARPNEPVT